MLTFIVVFGGSIVGVCFHEFSHALVAYWGGDYTVKEKGYLTLNPLKYTDIKTSIIFPMICLAIGGLPLPGGAVYIDRTLLKNSTWSAWVSLAGPIGTLVFALVLMLPFAVGLHTMGGSYELWSAVAFLILIELICVVFNLLPIPPMDGFGVVGEYLPKELRFAVYRLGHIPLIVLILLLFNTDIGDRFLYGPILQILDLSPVPHDMAIDGWITFSNLF